MNKLRVGVFLEGKSVEREVSFNSGRTICDHLDTSRYDIVPIFQNANGDLYILPWRFLHRGKISDFEHRLHKEAKKISWCSLKTLIDFMYIASHGHYAEDGVLQGFLEVLKIPYLGSKVLVSAIGMNKIVQKNILKANNFNVAKYITVEPAELKQYQKNQETLLAKLESAKIKYPVIVKPSKEGSSLGITVVYTKENLLPAILAAANIDSQKQQAVVIEELITGMEFSCIIITDYKTGNLIPLSVTEIVPEQGTDFFDYEQKYMPGRALKFTPARCNGNLIKKIQDTCLEVMRTLEIKNLGRIDGFLTKDETVVIIEPNTLAGMAPSSFVFRQAAEINMSHTAFINHLIETELAYYNMLDPILELEKGLAPQSKERSMDKINKIRVAVLLGGNSHEREISLESGRNIVYKLSPQKYEALPIFVDQDMNLYHIHQELLVRNSTKEISLGLEPKMKIDWDTLPKIADFVFIGLHGGEGENGCVQGTLEMLGMPYNGSSVLASAMCMDKFKTTEYLKNNGIAVPNNCLISCEQWLVDKTNTLNLLQKNLGNYPLIVKPHDDGCSVMVSKALNQQELIKSIESIFADGKKFALIEEFVVGMELTVGVIGNDKPQALPPSKAVCSGAILSIEEKFLPGAGENQTPAPLAPETLELVKATMAQAFKILDCKGYARIDCFYQNPKQSPTGQERVVIIEVNTLPGMTPATCIFHQAAEIGIKPMDFIDVIIQFGFEEHKPKISQTAQNLDATQVEI